MGRTAELRREIKRTFVPYLTGKGFACDMRDAPGSFTFRKINSDAVYVCDVQWEKSGQPRFVVNFGKCSAEGMTRHGRRVLPQDIRAVETRDYAKAARKPSLFLGDGILVPAGSADFWSRRCLLEASRSR